MPTKQYGLVRPEMSLHVLIALGTLAMLGSCASASAQSNFSNIKLTDLDHSSVRLTFDVTPAAFVQIRFGTKSGNYPYRSQSSGTIVPRSAIVLGGLRPSTTYYYVIEARFELDENCTPASCTTSREQSFITPAATHPVKPAPVVRWMPAHPDTSTYTVVRIVRGPSGNCIAAKNGSGTDGAGTWTVKAADDLQTVLTKIRYGTVVEFDQGIVCEIPPYIRYQGTDWEHGYTLPAKPADPRSSGIDDPAHRWIVLRTQQINSSDFPPFGARTGPSWTRAATLKASSALTEIPSRHAKVPNVGVIFFWEPNALSHHYWIENITGELSTSVTDPWQEAVRVGLPYEGMVLPKYNVLDRFQLKGSGAPRCTKFAVRISSQHFAMIGSYITGVDCPNDTVVGVITEENTLGPLTLENNYISAIGMGIYLESNGNRPTVPTDVTVTHNMLYWPWSTMQPRARTPRNNWDGYARIVRQQFESKGAERLKFDGNLIDGNWAKQNQGPAIFLSPIVSSLDGPTPNRDVTITNNLIRRVATVFHCGGTRGPSAVPDGGMGRRVLFSNNLAYDVGYGKYSQNEGAGLVSAYNWLGCMDLTMSRNTFGKMDYRQSAPGVDWAPGLHMIGYGPPLEGFSFTDNVYFVDHGAITGNGIVPVKGDRVDSHPQVPDVNTSNVAKTAFDSWAKGVSGNEPYTWSGNIAIGGQYNATRDMTASEVSELAAQMPGKDIWAPGKTIKARTAAAGLNDDYSMSTPGKGADVVAIYAAMGVVGNIAVKPDAASATWTYNAPDSRACSVDTGKADGAWSRTTDGGGSTSRTITVNNLSPNTKYQWRLTCYFDQVNYDLWKPDQITMGTFSTSPAN